MQTKKLIRANLTIGLIMANELIMSFFPDFYLYVIGSPPNPYPFYAMILNKGKNKGKQAGPDPCHSDSENYI